MKDDEICPLTFGSSLLLFFFGCSLLWCIASLPPISSFFLSPPPRTSSSFLILLLPSCSPPAPRLCLLCLPCATHINRSVSLRLAVPVVLPVARPWVPSPTRPRRRRSKPVRFRLAKRGQEIMYVHALYTSYMYLHVLHAYIISGLTKQGISKLA